MTRLTNRSCMPCTGVTPALAEAEMAALMPQVPYWTAANGKLVRELKFKNFAAAMEFLQVIGRIAEGENHHPDLHLYSWNRVRIEMFTHAIDGLSENDFILAAKIEQLLPEKLR